MRNLERRLRLIEGHAASHEVRWHRIIYDQDAYEQALAGYEATHGPIPAGDAIMRVEIFDPAQRGELSHG